MNIDLDFDEWLRIGLEMGFCGPAVCYTHDGFPMTEIEEEEFFEGEPCVHMLRIYYDEDHQKQVEDNHSPSVWRKPHKD